MADYWGANWRNFQRGLGLNSTPQEEVTGDLTGGLRELSAPPSAVAPSVYGIPSSAAPQPAVKPVVIGAPTDSARFPKGIAGLQPMVNTPAQIQAAQPQAAAAPVGKYGWKGSINAEGNPSLTFGTPGTDGGGIGSWRPGSATPAGPTDPSVINMPPAQGLSRMEPTGRMIQARSTSDFLPQQTAPTQAPIDFASMDRAGRRFALKNALLGQEQQQQGNTYDLGLRTIANSGANAQLEALTAADRTAAVRENIAAEGGLRQAQADELGVRAGAGLRLSAAADALTKAKPGTPEYDQALSTYQILSGGTKAKADEIQMIEEPIDPTKPELGVVKRPALMNPRGGTFRKMEEQKAPQPAPAAAIDYLKKNPGQAQAFKQKYGYLPE